FSYENDIAIIKLSTVLPTNSYITAACIPNEDWLEGEIGIFAGWFNGTYESATLDKLHQFQTQIRSKATCEEKYSYQFRSKMLCTSLPESGFNPCGYEVGAPLYTYKENTWILRGIATWIPDCLSADRLGMFTDVFQFRNWINRNINGR
uniref:Peptidase S1 domain-containing protein n=1 Tax=Biomphalaria glabrata TaxID=6526 RepID=A0A2C9LBY4_BIOGL